MSDLQKQAARFLAIFKGYEHAHGRYALKKGSSDSGKVVGAPVTIMTEMPVDAVVEHFKGGEGVGGLPLLEDDHVWWAALDIDDNSIDHAALTKHIKKLGLPLIVCRSKSGGAHCYVFFNTPQPASDVRIRLNEWSALLGRAGCEVFPKQDTRASKDDVGNWINLPYHNAAQGFTVRPAYDAEGKDMDLETFLTLVEKTRGVLPGSSDVVTENSGLLEDGPPCLQHILSRGGFGEGERNDGMFNVAVYLRKRYPEDWQNHMLKYNEEMCDPPMKAGEVVGVEKSASRKDYGYRCSQAPIKPFCQKRTCLRRRFGIGQSNLDEAVEITGLTKYDSGSAQTIRWGMTIAGGRIMVDTATLYDPSSFNRACMAVINRIPVSMPPARWRKHLDELLQKADVVVLPEDASPTGQVWLWIVSFMTQRAHAREMSEVLTGRPFHENGKVYFRSQDLFQFLKANRIDYEDETQVFHLLRDKGVEKKYHKIKKTDGSQTGANLWILPLPEDAQAPTNAANEQVEKEAF